MNSRQHRGWGGAFLIGSVLWSVSCLAVAPCDFSSCDQLVSSSCDVAPFQCGSPGYSVNTYNCRDPNCPPKYSQCIPNGATCIPGDPTSCKCFPWQAGACGGQVCSPLTGQCTACPSNARGMTRVCAPWCDPTQYPDTECTPDATCGQSGTLAIQGTSCTPGSVAGPDRCQQCGQNLLYQPNSSLCPLVESGQCQSVACNPDGSCSIFNVNEGQHCDLYNASATCCCGSCGACGSCDPPYVPPSGGTCPGNAILKVENFNVSDSSFTPSFIQPPANQPFNVACDYGLNISNCLPVVISPVVAGGPTCPSLPGGLVNMGHPTQVTYNCTAGTTPGVYTIACAAQGAPCQDSFLQSFCTDDSHTLGTLTVAPACTYANITHVIVLSPTTVATGQSFTVAYDFGSVAAATNGCVTMDDGGASAPCSPAVSGSTVTFTCLATGAPGPYPIRLSVADYTTCGGGDICLPASVVSITGLTISNNACGANGAVCGGVTSTENGIPLPGIVVELRNADGSPKLSQRTDASGHYNFPNIGGNKYFVNLAVEHTQTPSPLSQVADLRLANSFASRDFVVRGVPATLNFSQSKPASLIIISTFSISGMNGLTQNPPPGLNGLGTGTELYATTVGQDGTATVTVPSGTYYFTCWTPEAGGAFVRTQSKPVISGLSSVNPTEVHSSGLGCY